jgi:hypothetical protein
MNRSLFAVALSSALALGLAGTSFGQFGGKGGGKGGGNTVKVNSVTTTPKTAPASGTIKVTAKVTAKGGTPTVTVSIENGAAVPLSGSGGSFSNDAVPVPTNSAVKKRTLHVKVTATVGNRSNSKTIAIKQNGGGGNPGGSDTPPGPPPI